MEPKSEFKKLNKKAIALPFLVITLIFIILGILVVNGVRHHYVDHVEQLTKNLAEGYSYSMMNTLDAENVIRQLKKENHSANFMDGNFIIQYSTTEGQVGQSFGDPAIGTSLMKGEIVEKVTDEGNSYTIYHPISHEGNYIGTLVLTKPFDTDKSFVAQVTAAGLLALTFIFGSLLYMVNNTYKRNQWLFQLAYYDQLTGLPNGSYLKRHLENELQEMDKQKNALMLINFSNLKTINMTYGIKHGEYVLKEISGVLASMTLKTPSVFRLSTEKFVLYIDDYKDKENLVRIAKKIAEEFENPIYLDGFKKHLTIQIGIAEVKEKKSAEGLLKDILVTMNCFNPKSPGGYVFYDQEMQHKIDREEHLEEELREIIENQDFESLFTEYQPQLSLADDRICGFETLARMRSGTYGLISPLEFIDIAEKHQLIRPLGNMILRSACRFYNQLKNAGYSEIQIAVNISVLQLLDQDFIKDLCNIVEEEGMNLEYLEIEVTESVFVDDFDLINQKLEELSHMKVRVALDDFGTGYSSFFRLREMQVDTLKIDQYFISRISDLTAEKALTAEIIAIAHRLNLLVVAEGVEEESQFRYLMENNCDVIQGYFFSRPLLPDAALALVFNTND